MTASERNKYKSKSVELPTYAVDERVPKYKTSLRKFEVKKFTDQAIPEDIYEVHLDATNGQIYCACYGFMRMKGNKSQHKHIRLVKEWLRRGSVVGEIFHLVGDDPVFVRNILAGCVDDPNA